MAHSDARRKDSFEQPALTPDTERPRPYLVDPHRAHCPDNHRLHDAELTLEDGIIRCKYKFPAPGGRGYQGECGRLLLAVAGFHSRKGRPMILLAPVTIQDIRHMQELKMTAEEELAYVGLIRAPR